MKKILFYVNSNYGIGHYQRIFNIVKALCHYPKIRATVLYGGVPLHIFNRLPNCKLKRLEGLTYWGDTVSETIRPFQKEESVPDVFRKRENLIQQVLNEEKFNVLFIEYFPFSKHQLVKEVLNIISLFKKQTRKGYIVSSVRDIIHGVDGHKQVLTEELIDCYFDYILIHSDPEFISFEESYGDISKFSKKIIYTGFIISENGYYRKGSTYSREPSIIVSTGGGRDGYPLIASFLTAIEKARVKLDNTLSINVFPGPFIPEDNLREIKKNFKNACLMYNIRIRKPYEYYFVRNNAILSISMCGYNTCYELLARNIPMIFFPRKRKEQLLRAQSMDKLGIAKVVYNIEDLVAILEEERIKKEISPSNIEVDFNGARKTADFLAHLCY